MPSSTPSGIGKVWSAGAAAYSAYPPERSRDTTRRPSGSVPATSPPSTSGSSKRAR